MKKQKNIRLKREQDLEESTQVFNTLLPINNPNLISDENQ